MTIFVGIILMLAAVGAFLVALPRGERVVPFLRSDALQSAYVVAILALLVIGAVTATSSMTGVEPLTGYQ